MFYLGLCMFFGIHLITLTPSLKAALSRRTGSDPWRGVVALVSGVGIALVCLGWSQVPATVLFPPVMSVVSVAPYLISLAMILVLAGGLGFKAHMRHFLRHPMVIGVALWALTHLLANGGLRETMLFGSFLVFSIYALYVLFARGDKPAFTPSLKWDLAAIVLGSVVAVGFMHSHRIVFGVAVT